MLYGVVALLLLAADQGLKLWVSGNFELLESRPLIPGLVELKYVQNTGGGWSVLSDHTWLLSLFTALIIAAVAVLLLRRIVRHPVGLWACALILSGGMGNLIDRLRLGYVVDMFNFLFMDYPVFNIADICVVCGILLGAVYYLFLYEKYDAPKKEGESHGADPRRP